MRLLISLVLLPITFSGIFAQQKVSPDITINDLKVHLYTLASESFSGRFPGSPGGKAAAEYIARDFKNSGLSLFNKSGLQPFEVLIGQEPGKNNLLKVNGKKLKINTDYAPFSISANGMASGQVIFAGYGLDIKTDTFQWNDYGSTNVKGKIVLLLRGSPESEKYQPVFDSYTDEIVKAIYARDKGAAAVLFVSGKKFDPSEKLPKMNLRESSAGIPVLQITREIADRILAGANQDISTLENKIESSFQPSSIELKTLATLVSDIQKINTTTHNVVGYVYAADTSKVKDYVVIGAHYDHLGSGGPGSSSRIQDTLAVHNGADDNASGVAVMMELAAHFCREKDKLRHNLVFVAFGAEEMGILGSRYFVENSPVALPKINAMINLDMVGRLKEDTLLQVNGSGTSKEAVTIINTLNSRYDFNLRMAPEGYGPSDHAAFYGKNIPVFFSTRWGWRRVDSSRA
jgi:hypothetical protein